MEELAKALAALPPILQLLLGVPVLAVAGALYVITLKNGGRQHDTPKPSQPGPPAPPHTVSGDPGFAAFTLIVHTMPEMLSRLTVIHEGVVRMERQQAKRDEDFEREQAERDEKLVKLARGIKRRFNRLLEKLGEPRDEEDD